MLTGLWGQAPCALAGGAGVKGTAVVQGGLCGNLGEWVLTRVWFEWERSSRSLLDRGGFPLSLQCSRSAGRTVFWLPSHPPLFGWLCWALVGRLLVCCVQLAPWRCSWGCARGRKRQSVVQGHPFWRPGSSVLGAPASPRLAQPHSTLSPGFLG